MTEEVALMGQRKVPDEKVRAERSLKRSGVGEDQLRAYELAILREVQSHGSISGNSSEYIFERIEDLAAE